MSAASQIIFQYRAMRKRNRKPASRWYLQQAACCTDANCARTLLLLATLNQPGIYLNNHE